MNFKPQNLYISVIDLFSIFIPGGIATVIIYHNFNDLIHSTFVIDERSTNYTWAIVLLYAYILGHFINRIGSNFDGWFYDKWKKRHAQSHKDKVKKLIDGDSDEGDIKSTFTRAKYRIIYSGSPIIQKIEKEMADSKFFRSLLVISFGLIFLYTSKRLFTDNFNDNWWILLLLSIILGAFSCWSYFKLRYKSTVTAYKYVIFMEAMKKKENEL